MKNLAPLANGLNEPERHQRKGNRAMRICLILMVLVVSACTTLESTSSAPEDREKFLTDYRCAKSFERMQNFVKYWKPSPKMATEYWMYKDGKVGFRGYDLLGDLYYRGCESANLSPDKGLAAYWYLNAANGHVPEAQFKLGKMMYEGDGIEKNEESGMEWITSAALEQNSDARAFLLSKGLPVPSTSGPNTYDKIQQELRRQKKQQNAEYWSGFFDDLLGVVVLAGATYLTLKATMPNQYLPSQSSSHGQSVEIYRYRPVWCSSNIIGTTDGVMVSGTVSTFCN